MQNLIKGNGMYLGNEYFNKSITDLIKRFHVQVGML